MHHSQAKPSVFQQMPQFIVTQTQWPLPPTLASGGCLGKPELKKFASKFASKIEPSKIDVEASSWYYFSCHFWLQNVALYINSGTCAFKGRKHEFATPTALLALRRSMFIVFLIFVTFHLNKHYPGQRLPSENTSQLLNIH